MNRRTAAPVILTVSLVVLMSGCAGAAAQGGQVRDDLRPAANAAVMGLARGHVVVKDDLARSRVSDAMAAQALADPHGFSADARRELHSQPVSVEQGAFSADARRELHSQPVAVEQGAFSADVRRELHSQPVAVEQSAMTADARRELKGSAPTDVQDDLSPTRGGSPTTAPQGDTVDDDLSPLGQ